MSANSNQQKQLHKMCKSPPKNLNSNTTYHQTKQQQQQPSPKSTTVTAKSLNEIGNYEIPNTNCTMVGSNNLTLDSKLNASIAYQIPQIKVCAKPMKSPGDSPNLLKKPHSPRSLPMETFMHNSLVQNITKYTAANVVSNFNHLRGLQPSPTPTMAGTAGYNKLVTFEGLQGSAPVSSYAQQQQQQQALSAVRITKSSAPPSFTNISSPVNANLNNGVGMCAMSPSAYSNPSPSYPSNAVSPYNVQISSPANSVSSITSGVAGIKSPIPSPQNIRPPTPQPILPQAFQQIPVMTSGPNLVQIIHASNSAPAYQNHAMLTRQTIIAPPTQNMQNSSPIIKIKPPLNILPKPPSSGAVPPGGNKQTGARGALANQAQGGQQLHQNAASPATQIVLPNQTILPTAQPGTLLLNQMPLIVQQNTAQGVQLILRPGTPNSGPHLAAAAAAGKLGTPQNLILQQTPGPGSAGPQVLIQHTGGQRQTTLQQPQQLVRVLTANGMIQQIAAPTYIAMNNQQLSIQQLSQQQQQQQQQQSTVAPQKTQIVTGTHMSTPLQHNHLINACLPGGVTQQQGPPVTSMVPNVVEQLPPPKKKPKKKKKNKETKLDLANLMKLSGIGDDDVESDTSESASLSEPNHNAQKIIKSEVLTPTSEANELTFPKRIGNIHISAITQDPGPKLSQTITPATQNNILTNKTVPNFNQSQISVQQSLSDINAINQNLAHIGLINQNAQNFISTSNQILSQINTGSQNNPTSLINSSDNQNLANLLQALNQTQNFPLINGQGIQNISVSQAGIPVSSVQGLPTFPNSNPSSLPTSTYPKFSANILPTGQSTNTTFASNIMSNIVTASSMNQNLNNASDSGLNNLPKSQPTSIFTQTQQKPQQNLANAHFNLPNAIPNIQVQNFCGSNQNLILNQGANTIITPNIPNFSGNITINNSLIPNTNLTLPNNIMPNFLSTNLVQPTADVNSGFGNGNIQRTGGFKLALSEDGRLILQHDPNLNQDIQSQLLLQSIFGINLQGGNLVLTSVNNTIPQPPKPITELPKPKPELTNTKTTSIIQNVIPSIKTEAQPMVQHQPQPPPIQHTLPQPAQPAGLNHQQPVEPLNATSGSQQPQQQQQPNNFSYIVNLTPDQLETLKRNGQLTVNGQTIFMHRPGVKEAEKALNQVVKSSPKSKNSKKKQQFDNKTAKTALQEHLHIKNQQNSNDLAAGALIGQRFTNQNIQTTPAPSPQPIITSQSQTLISALQTPSKNLVLPQQAVTVPAVTSEAKLHPPHPQIAAPSQPEPQFNATQNMICIQPNANKPVVQPMPTVKVNEPQIPQHLLNPKANIMKPNNSNEQLILFQPQSVDTKPGVISHQPHEKKLLNHQELPKTDAELRLPNTSGHTGVDKPDNAQLNVEQFLSNLNINPANLGQLISQKLNQELPGGVDHKIVNIAPGSTAGHIVAKIDISSENMQQILAGNGEAAPAPNNDTTSLAVPPLVSMNMKSESDVFTGHVPAEPVQNQQLPALIIGGNVPTEPPPTPGPPPAVGDAATNRQGNANTVYQRIQTIQLTPQKQQLLKSVQLQIQALTARLQQKPNDKNSTADSKNISDSDIHTALRHLFMEQQKILATGKVIPTINPPISSLNCSMETGSTQSVPVTTASKNNNTFLTSLLQQPVVSHHQNNKVYYHHANQIIAISPTQWQQNQNILPNPVVTPSITAPGAGGPIALKIKKMSPIQPNTTFLSPTKLAPVQSVERGLQVSPLPVEAKVNAIPVVAGCAAMSPAKRIMKPTYSKAQLIEQQLTTDQNGAMNPDITRPFASKEDACKRLVRYHCYNQPVLSQKDLNKADEIFELTARHFIEKFKMMVNKYKYLLFKESMREVQTSELMMIDRMFLAEEQQSFLKLQSDVKLQNELEAQENVEASLQEMYKKETDPESASSLPFDDDVKPDTRDFIADDFMKGFVEKPNAESFTVKTENCDKSERYDEGNTDFNIKCGVNYFSDDDESCESGSNYRVYEESPKEFEEFIGTGPENKDQKKTGMESYNTTKIIGNFEIEINNKGCNAQESYTKNFRQKIIENKLEKEDAFMQKGHGDNEDYDEWLCIQRELGYFPPDGKPDADQKSSDQSVDHSAGGRASPELKSSKIEAEIYKKSSHKRSSSDTSRLETLKKFRVEKHNAKVKKTGSIIGEVKFEVRIEHKKVFTEQTKKGESQGEHPKQTLKRSQCFDYPNNSKVDSDLYSSKRACMSQNFKTNEASQPQATPPALASCASCHQPPTATIKQEEPSLDDTGSDLNESGEIFDRSIDEQVQSAIDSILNLQQISSSMTGGSAAAAVAAAAAAAGGGTEKNEAMKSKQPTDNGNSELMNYSSKTNEFCDTADTLDEAVKSILS